MVQFDRQKFKSVIHYVCSAAPSAELGKVKLHKILYFADMLRYLDKGVPLTGAEYQKQQFGPAAKNLTWALDELAQEGRLRVSRSVDLGFPRYEFVSLEEPARGVLSDSDRHLLGEVIEFVCSGSARAVSDLSHDAAWESAAIGETIPYYTAFLMVPCEVTDEDVAWGEAEARRLLAAA